MTRNNATQNGRPSTLADTLEPVQRETTELNLRCNVSASNSPAKTKVCRGSRSSEVLINGNKRRYSCAFDRSTSYENGGVNCDFHQRPKSHRVSESDGTNPRLEVDHFRRKSGVDGCSAADSRECLISFWRRYRMGEQTAFTPIDNAYRSRLAGWLRRTFPNGYHDETAQDALSILADKKPLLESEGQLYAWLKTTAKRLLFNSTRRRRPMANSSLLEGL